ncbi:MAG: hypothetical protein IPL73_27015 [Candidatus Obscuribacter sp.]|nr:hypothetical protein [Candidatus Obscuribacter sp.]
MTKSTLRTDREANLETQSGFLIVLKGAGDKLTLSVRRRVGTPPTSSVTLTPDEVRHFSNQLADVLPQSRNEKIAVGPERNAENQPVGELDLFMEREYPGLAAKKRHRTGSSGGFTLPKEAIKTGVLALALVSVVGGMVAYFAIKPKSKKVVAEVAQVQEVTPDVEGFSRKFIGSMLDFKRESCRPSQIKALSMMTPELQKAHWAETGFPMTRAQISKLPAEQEVRVESVNIVALDPTNYEVDATGGVVTGGTTGSESMPFHLKLNVVKTDDGLLVSSQKDMTAEAAK